LVELVAKAWCTDEVVLAMMATLRMIELWAMLLVIGKGGRIDEGDRVGTGCSETDSGEVGTSSIVTGDVAGWHRWASLLKKVTITSLFR
jgi:hypothetical protein